MSENTPDFIIPNHVEEEFVLNEPGLKMYLDKNLKNKNDIEETAWRIRNMLSQINQNIKGDYGKFQELEWNISDIYKDIDEKIIWEKNKLAKSSGSLFGFTTEDIAKKLFPNETLKNIRKHNEASRNPEGDPNKNT